MTHPATEIEPLAYYVMAECPECDSDVFYGICVSMLTHRGFPVVTYDVAVQTSFTCDECGCEFGTEDFELEVFEEGNQDNDDEDPDDDD